MTRIGPVVGVTSVLKAQDITMGGDLAAWGARTALDAILDGTEYLSVTAAREAGMAAVRRQRDIGSTVHAAIEQILRGDQPAPTPDTAPYIYAFSAFLAAERPEFIAVEQRVVHRQAKYAGTLDMLGRLPRRGNRVFLADVKTGRWKASFALQLGAYEMGESGPIELDQWHRYWYDSEATFTRLPRVSDHYILLLRPEGYEFVPVTVTASDRRHFLNLVKTYHAIRAWDDAAKAAAEEAAA